MTRALEDLLLELAEAAPADLPSQLAWLERASTAAAEAELGEAGQAAALDLRAALGAFVEFSRGPRGRGEQLALEMTVRTLITRALHTLYAALSETYAALGRSDEQELGAECRELARLFGLLARNVEKGKPIRPEIMRKLEAMRERVRERS
jgi:hypothetical protein